MLSREGMLLQFDMSHKPCSTNKGGDLMNMLVFRSQTTKGIWMAKCVGIEPCTLVMDLEGTDGRERGEVFSPP